MRQLIFRFFGFILIFGLIYSCSTHAPKKPVQYSSRTHSQKEEPVKQAIEKDLSKIEKTETPKKTEKEVKKPEDEEIELRVELPEVKRDFRAAWIASVANINWPSKRGLSVEQQKEEAIQILNSLQQNNFNAVILQIRPSADALYDSPFEPWSVFLNGETGRAPVPYYDPLEFWIEEAHKRGLELHAWLNPYRVHHTNGGKINSASMVNKMPNEVLRLSNGMYWFDPGLKATQDHVSQVVMDIVKRYDIDGIHFDDYFYPYSSYNNGDFPDSKSWNAYKNSGGTLSKADWRRDNVNKFIQRIYTEIKAEKNWVQFGISPFGIWKSGVPAGVSGLSQYDELYADAKLWLNKGWIDYFTPQLYWPIDAPKQGFVNLLSWWQSENTHKRHLWPGLNTVEIKASDKPTEIIRQIEATRRLMPDDSGVAHWSMAGLNQNMLNSLKNGPYREKALIPETTWLKPTISGKPKLNLTHKDHQLEARWSFEKKDEVRQWILYSRYGNDWDIKILDPDVLSLNLAKTKNGQSLNLVVVKAVGRLGNESNYSAKLVK